MKKKIIALCLVVILALTAVGGATLAYFTDKDTVNNTFTVGKVKITLDEAPVDESGKAKENEDRVQQNTYEAALVPGHVFDKDPTIHVKAGSENSYIYLDMQIRPWKSLLWVMAADASADETINFTIYDEDGNLKSDFKNTSGAFASTKFLAYMVKNKTIFQAMIGKWFQGIEHKNWELCDIMTSQIDETADALTFRFAYKGDTDADGNKYTVNAKTATDDIDIKFMDTFGMPSSVTQEMIADGKTKGGMQYAFGGDEFGSKLNMNFTAYAIQADGMTDWKNAYQKLFNNEVGSAMSGFAGGTTTGDEAGSGASGADAGTE